MCVFTFWRAERWPYTWSPHGACSYTGTDCKCGTIKPHAAYVHHHYFHTNTTETNKHKRIVLLWLASAQKTPPVSAKKWPLVWSPMPHPISSAKHCLRTWLLWGGSEFSSFWYTLRTRLLFNSKSLVFPRSIGIQLGGSRGISNYWFFLWYLGSILSFGSILWDWKWQNIERHLSFVPQVYITIDALNLYFCTFFSLLIRLNEFLFAGHLARTSSQIKEGES